METNEANTKPKGTKDYMLRVRMDEETLKMLDACCKQESFSRSKVVRSAIAEHYERLGKE